MWYHMAIEQKKKNWEKVIAKTNEHGYMSGVDRQSERVKATGEVFTPTPLVIEIMKKMLADDREVFAPGKTVIDPACGDGQFLVPVKWYKVIFHGMSEQDALNDIYGVDIMRDNVDLCKLRLGGGHILMGNTLDPTARLDKQTDFEYNEMKRLFVEENTLESFFG
jgi:2-polyprenyl-3-methyl-5-hydroxy-6-metoxy-1,4-benzoquinol methylase